MNAQFFLNPLILIKGGLLILIFLFAIFTLVILNQVLVMNRIISQQPVATVVAWFAVLLVLLSFSLFVATLVIL
ncbi:MAG: hypothetical protein HYT10_00970 [Candidatus Levybacteria bacterium]|nr:hypothetical protein [Candidatus Levybacteria bacterium]